MIVLKESKCNLYFFMEFYVIMRIYLIEFWFFIIERYFKCYISFYYNSYVVIRRRIIVVILFIKKYK